MNNAGFFAVQQTSNNRSSEQILRLDSKAYNRIFNNIYSYAMNLIDKMSNYIDGPGRMLPKSLNSELGALYTSEAMTSSTRLMQIASWLLLMRSAIEKEMTVEDLMHEKGKLCLQTPSLSKTSPLWLDLPDAFRVIVEESLALEKRLRYLDQQMQINTADCGTSINNNVLGQQQRLREVFTKI